MKRENCPETLARKSTGGRFCSSVSNQPHEGGGAGDGGISTNKFDSYSVTVEKPCLLQEHYFLDKCLIKNLIEQWCLTDTGCKGIGEALSSSSSVAAGNI